MTGLKLASARDIGPTGKARQRSGSLLEAPEDFYAPSERGKFKDNSEGDTDSWQLDKHAKERKAKVKSEG